MAERNIPVRLTADVTAYWPAYRAGQLAASAFPRRSRLARWLRRVTRG